MVSTQKLLIDIATRIYDVMVAPNLYGDILSYVLNRSVRIRFC